MAEHTADLWAQEKGDILVANHEALLVKSPYKPRTNRGNLDNTRHISHSSQLGSGSVSAWFSLLKLVKRHILTLMGNAMGPESYVRGL